MNLPEHNITVHDHPEPHSQRWSDLELKAIKRYAEAYALLAVEALHPVAMTENEAKQIMADLNLSRTQGTRCWGWIDVIRATEAFHHITKKEQP